MLLAVRLTPKGGRDSIDGIEERPNEGPVLKARVRQPAHAGAANAALEALIADRLAIPASRVRLVAGASSRVKTLKISGHAGTLCAALASLSGSAPAAAS